MRSIDVSLILALTRMAIASPEVDKRVNMNVNQAIRPKSPAYFMMDNIGNVGMVRTALKMLIFQKQTYLVASPTTTTANLILRIKKQINKSKIKPTTAAMMPSVRTFPPTHQASIRVSDDTLEYQLEEYY